MVKKICEVCKKTFEVVNAQKDRIKCCSLKCRYIRTSGKGHPGWKGTGLCACGAKKHYDAKSCKPCYGLRNRGKNHYNFKGYRLSNGYKLIPSRNHPFTDKNGYVFEHRLVMEKSLGRYLKPEEVVHHINHQRTDNRLKNLRLYSSHSNHMKFGHKELKHNLPERSIVA